MRILVISNLFPPEVLGGYEILCAQVCDELRRLGHAVHVLTTGSATPASRETSNAGLEIRRELDLYLPFDRPARLLRCKRWSTGRGNCLKAAAAIADIDPDVVFMWSQLRLTTGPLRAVAASGKPVVYAINDESLAGYLPSKFRRTLRGLYRYLADNVVFRATTLSGSEIESSVSISRCVRDNLVRAGIHLDDDRVIYQGIPIERFPVKRQLGRLHDPIRILYVGQLQPYKGVHVFLEAVSQYAARQVNRNVTATVVGIGSEEYRKQLEQIAEQSPATVRFAGFQPRETIAGHYRDHDITVFPSLWAEPFGLTHLESMASGTPVISTANGGQGEFLLDETNAMVVDPGDPSLIADAIECLVDDPALRRRIAASGRALVERKFTLTHYARQLEKRLLEVAA